MLSRSVRSILLAVYFGVEGTVLAVSAHAERTSTMRPALNGYIEALRPAKHFSKLYRDPCRFGTEYCSAHPCQLNSSMIVTRSPDPWN